MAKTPEKLDELLNQKKAGIIIRAEDIQDEADIPGLLEVADRLASIQFSAIPTPDKQRKYITLLGERTNTSRAFHLLKIFAWPTSLVILFVVGLQTYQSTSNSLPGSKLYPIKKLSEQAQIYTVQKDTDKLAQAQLDLTERRLSEAQIALNSSDVNEAIRSQALEELNSQAKTALPIIKDALSNNSNPQLVKNLENLNQKLTSLPKSTKEAKNLALASELAKQSQKTTDEVLNIIAATPGDTILTLESQNSAQVSGKITSITKDSLVVEKTTFTYNPAKLIIKRVSGLGTVSDLTLKATVTVKSARNVDGLLEATEITITQPAPSPTPKPSQEIKNPEINESVTAPQTQNTLQAGLIIEDPRPTTK